MSVQCEFATPDFSIEEVGHEEDLLMDEGGKDLDIHSIDMSPGRDEQFVEQPSIQASTEDTLDTLVNDSQDYLMLVSQLCRVVNSTLLPWFLQGLSMMSGPS